MVTSQALASADELSGAALVQAVLDLTGTSQVELAAALNVTQPALSQWLAGTRVPNPATRAQLGRALEVQGARAREVPLASTRLGYQPGAVLVPTEPWEPVFEPRARFRLPQRLEWSGSPRQRWRDARDIDRLLGAYEIVIANGRAQDMVLWVDLRVLARNIGRMFWPRGFEPAWREAMTIWGYL